MFSLNLSLPQNLVFPLHTAQHALVICGWEACPRQNPSHRITTHQGHIHKLTSHSNITLIDGYCLWDGHWILIDSLLRHVLVNSLITVLHHCILCTCAVMVQDISFERGRLVCAIVAGCFQEKLNQTKLAVCFLGYWEIYLTWHSCIPLQCLSGGFFASSLFIRIKPLEMYVTQLKAWGNKWCL